MWFSWIPPAVWHGPCSIQEKQWIPHGINKEMEMKNLALLFLRLVVGTLLAGHGSQKLFGWFEGPGLKGTHGFMEMLGLKPGRVWGTVAALGEFVGGIFTALGFLNPLGPMNVAAAMTVAIRRAHWGKPIWAASGGAELPLTNLAAVSVIAAAGPGRYSLDSAFGIKLPRWLVALAGIWTAGVTIAALQRPEIAQTVLDKASDALPASLKPSGLEVENRPAPVDAPQAAAEV
jgi:putative oxidoreductase